jgi:lysophospholipase L1-like esterase
MRNCLLFLFVITLVSCHSSSKLVVTQPNDAVITAYGRTLLDAGNDLVLIGSASYAEFSFTSDSCIIYLKNVTWPADYNYVAIEVDNEYKGRLKIDGTDPKPFTIHTTANNSSHILRIYKATEASNGLVVITEIKAARLQKVPQKTRKKIEFIGNSITAGMANDLKDIPCHTGKWYDQHNAYWAYGPRVARALDTDFMISAVSGIGIYRTWNGNGPSMPLVYESAYLKADNDQQWDFNRYTPDVVSICLGTNDLSDGDGKSERLPFDSSVYIRNYVEFIGTLYKHYPSTQIALLTSPMLSGQKAAMLLACLQSIKARISQQYPEKRTIEIFQFKPMVPKGCDYHPDINDHETMANEVIPFFRKLLEQ